MGVVLVDLTDEKHFLRINWYNWRPILAFLREANLITLDQCERMSGGAGCGGRMTADECQKSAEFLEKLAIQVKDDQQIHVDKRISTVPSSPQLITQTPADDLYATTSSKLKSFIEFCRTCQGFEVF